jgi:hypothetical protein
MGQGASQTLASRHRTQAVLRLIRVGSFVRVGPGVPWPVGGDSSVSPEGAIMRAEGRRESAAGSSRQTRHGQRNQVAGKRTLARRLQSDAGQHFAETAARGRHVL